MPRSARSPQHSPRLLLARRGRCSLRPAAAQTIRRHLHSRKPYGRPRRTLELPARSHRPLQLPRQPASGRATFRCCSSSSSPMRRTCTTSSTFAVSCPPGPATRASMSRHAPKALPPKTTCARWCGPCSKTASSSSCTPRPAKPACSVSKLVHPGKLGPNLHPYAATEPPCDDVPPYGDMSVALTHDGFPAYCGTMLWIPDTPVGEMRVGGRRLTAKDIALGVGAAADFTGRPVVDATGLTGTYDLLLDYAPVTSDPSRSAEPSNGVPLEIALRKQLGLKLEPGKGPVEVYVIDHVSKPAKTSLRTHLCCRDLSAIIGVPQRVRSLGLVSVLCLKLLPLLFFLSSPQRGPQRAPGSPANLFAGVGVCSLGCKGICCLLLPRNAHAKNCFSVLPLSRQQRLHRPSHQHQQRSRPTLQLAETSPACTPHAIASASPPATPPRTAHPPPLRPLPVHAPAAPYRAPACRSPASRRPAMVPLHTGAGSFPVA